MIAADRLVTRSAWQTGVARVAVAKGPHVLVDCPHCAKQHQHPRNFIGSRHVIAGCHTGFSRCREYAVIQTRGPRR